MNTNTMFRCLLAFVLISGLATVALAQSGGLMTIDQCNSDQAFSYKSWQFKAGFKAPCCKLCYTVTKDALEVICNRVYKGGKAYFACGRAELAA